jgi:hypothetical protein
LVAAMRGGAHPEERGVFSQRQGPHWPRRCIVTRCANRHRLNGSVCSAESAAPQRSRMYRGPRPSRLASEVRPMHVGGAAHAAGHRGRPGCRPPPRPFDPPFPLARVRPYVSSACRARRAARSVGQRVGALRRPLLA